MPAIYDDPWKPLRTYNSSSDAYYKILLAWISALKNAERWARDQSTYIISIWRNLYQRSISRYAANYASIRSMSVMWVLPERTSIGISNQCYIVLNPHGNVDNYGYEKECNIFEGIDTAHSSVRHIAWWIHEWKVIGIKVFKGLHKDQLI